MQTTGSDTWPLIASLFYMVAWSASFYPQIYENYRLRSVQGFNLDYLFLNISGYTFYTVYCSLGRFTDLKGAGSIEVADLIFVYHAVAMVAIQVVQACIYKRGRNRITKCAVIITCILWGIILIELILSLTRAVEYSQYWNPITVLGYGKLVITLIKYIPQAYWNYRRKSTIGWSNAGVLLDILGGVCSLVSGGLSVENGLNIIKLSLAIISLVFDVIFCIQHFWLYRQNPQNLLIQEDEREAGHEPQGIN